MSGPVAFLPGVQGCELCECAPARCNFEDLWLCEACLDQIRAAPAPVQTPARPLDDARYGVPLETIIEQLLREPG